MGTGKSYIEQLVKHQKEFVNFFDYSVLQHQEKDRSANQLATDASEDLLSPFKFNFIPENTHNLRYIIEPFLDNLDEIDNLTSNRAEKILYLFRLLSVDNLISTRTFTFFYGNDDMCNEPEYQVFLYNQPKTISLISSMMCNDFKYPKTQMSLTWYRHIMNSENRSHRFFLLHSMHFTHQYLIYKKLQTLLQQSEDNIFSKPISEWPESSAKDFYMLRTSVKTDNPNLAFARHNNISDLHAQHPEHIEQYKAEKSKEWGRLVNKLFSATPQSPEKRQLLIQALNAAIFFPSMVLNEMQVDDNLINLSKILMQTKNSYDHFSHYAFPKDKETAIIDDYLKITNQGHKKLNKPAQEIIKSHHNFAFRLFISEIIHKLEMDETYDPSNDVFSHQLPCGYTLEYSAKTARMATSQIPSRHSTNIRKHSPNSIKNSLDALFDGSGSRAKAQSQLMTLPASLQHNEAALQDYLQERSNHQNELTQAFSSNPIPDAIDNKFKKSIEDRENNLFIPSPSFWESLVHTLKMLFSANYRLSHENFIAEASTAAIRSNELLEKVTNRLIEQGFQQKDADQIVANHQRIGSLPKQPDIY